jgi:hypothetical protein
MNLLSVLAAALLSAAPGPTITMDESQISAVVGQTIPLHSTVTGQSRPAIAHLNVTSLDGVYVDLEDWTKDVTQSVPAGEAQLDWEVQAVNSGHFALYVVLIPQSGPLMVSPPVHVTVAARQTLDTAGALPVAIAIPTLLGLAALVTRRPWERT